MRRILTTSLVVMLATAASAFAEEGQALAPSITTVVSGLAQKTDPAAANDFAARFRTEKRPMMLPALYAGTAALQGYDAYSTLSVLKRGGLEANPMMKTLTKSPIAFIALKAGMATMSIVAAERMWKNHNRVGAVATMLVSNGFMAYVAAHNAGVLKKMQ